ncbi:hydroxyproline-rich glycoprotein family protein [Striga hermonthica]|uniref:Hydroxyproline-rich glycoprotein family protein n=1 Tax=Striga hermonthica TaxID=68872 RepID=A0A9N7NPP5_STRHE|nr:hydroxyproline-rich glycoprotein family protein [Striga hermonthica]
MEYPHGRHHGGHHRRDEEEEGRYGHPPPLFGADPPPPPFFGGDAPPPPFFGGNAPPPPFFGGNAPPPPFFGGDKPPPPFFAGNAPTPPFYGGNAPPPPQVYHTSHMGPPGPATAEHPHHHPHIPPAADHHHHHHKDELSNKPSVRMYCKADTNYALTIRDGKVVLAPADPSDPRQQWIKDEKFSTRVKDEEGFPSFALVNKATRQAIKHSIGATQPVQLTDYNANGFDESILWTESKDLGDGYRAAFVMALILSFGSGKRVIINAGRLFPTKCN